MCACAPSLLSGVSRSTVRCDAALGRLLTPLSVLGCRAVSLPSLPVRRLQFVPVAARARPSSAPPRRPWMVKLSVSLSARLRSLGIVDQSLCRECLARLEEAERAQAQAALKANQQPNAAGRQMWSTLVSTHASKSMGSTGEAAAPRPLRPHETLSSLNTGLSMLTIDDSDAERMLERGDRTLDRNPDCPRCKGKGLDRIAQFGYSEEVENNVLHKPGTAAAAAATGMAHSGAAATSHASSLLTVFSPQAPALKALLQSERSLPSLLHAASEARKADRSNSMFSGLGSSAILIRKQDLPSANPVKPTPQRMPTRSRTWLYAQFEELRLNGATASRNRANIHNESNIDEDDEDEEDAQLIPPLTLLDSALEHFVNLHTLHVSHNRLRVLEHLPPSIKVVHAAANRLTHAELKARPTPTKEQLALWKKPRPYQWVTGGIVQPHAPHPGLPPSMYLHLMHLGLAYNQFSSLRSLLPTAGTLRSLDVSWNQLSDLPETTSILAHFQNLTNLHLAGNPIALHRCYRAAILDVFVTMAEERAAEKAAATTQGAQVAQQLPTAATGTASSLDLLDGFATNTHQLKHADAMAAAAAAQKKGEAAADSTRSSARSGSISGAAAASADGAGSDRSASGSARRVAGTSAPTTAVVAAASAPVKKKGKKATAQELAEAAEAERQAALRAADELRRAEEDRAAALNLRPSAAELAEPVSLLLIAEGALRGLPDPRLAFDAAYAPAPVEEEGAKGKHRGGGGAKDKEKTGAATAAAATDKEKPSSATAAAGAKSTKKSKAAAAAAAEELAAAAASDPWRGWFVASTRSETLLPSGCVFPEGSSNAPNAGGGTTVTRSTVRQQVRYYLEVRVPLAEQSVQQIANHDGMQLKPAVAGDSGSDGQQAQVLNPGNGRPPAEGTQILRSVEYEYEQICGLSAGTVPLSNFAPAGSTSALRPPSAGVAFAQELLFQPTVAWRDTLGLLGFDVLLYARETLHEEAEATTTMAPRPVVTAEQEAAAAAAAAATTAGSSKDSTPLGTRRSSAGSSSGAGSKRDSHPSSASKKAGSSGGGSGGSKPSDSTGKRKSKKGAGAAESFHPPEIFVSHSSRSYTRHMLLGFGHVDCAPMLAVHPRRTLSTHVLARENFEMRRPPGQEREAVEAGACTVYHSNHNNSNGNSTNGCGSSTSESSPPPPAPLLPSEGPGATQWHPQGELRLAVEHPSISGVLPRALAKARAEGVEIKFAPLVQSPPHLQSKSQEEKENGSATAVPTTAAPALSAAGKTKGAAGVKLSAADRDRLAQEAAAVAAAAAAEQYRRDPVFTLPLLSVCLNCRPAGGSGLGHPAYRMPPPEPTPEEAAAAAAAAEVAAAAAASRKGRKSPAPGSKKAAAAAHAPPSGASNTSDVSADV